MSDQQQGPQQLTSTRMGSRWLYAHPSDDELKEWFELQQLHPGMKHGPYLGGIVVISATEKPKVTMLRADGQTYVKEMEQQVFVPYVKVDTRIAYFRDYVRVLNGGREFGDYYGVMRPVEQTIISDQASAFFNAHLPKGYSVYPVRQNENNVSRYLVATFEVVIYKRGDKGEPDTMVLRGQGSKQTAMKRQFPDDNAIMKAETGAIGRALGVAGMLVVGTGVATAEDVQEALSARPGETVAAVAKLPDDAGGDAALTAAITEPQLPAENRPEAMTAEDMGDKLPQDDGELRKMAGQLNAKLKAHFPVAWQEYIDWWNGRGFGTLDELSGPALKGAVIKLQRDLDERERAGTDLVKESE